MARRRRPFSTLSSGLVTETRPAAPPRGRAPSLSVPYPRVWSRKPPVAGGWRPEAEYAFSTLSSGLVTETTEISRSTPAV